MAFLFREMQESLNRISDKAPPECMEEGWQETTSHCGASDEVVAFVAGGMGADSTDKGPNGLLIRHAGVSDSRGRVGTSSRSPSSSSGLWDEELCRWRMSDELDPMVADTARARYAGSTREANNLRPTTALISAP